MPFWTTVWNYTMSRGYIRYPLALLPPLVWARVTGDFFDTKFKELNAGHAQIDVWQRIATKVAQLEKEDAEAAE